MLHKRILLVDQGDQLLLQMMSKERPVFHSSESRKASSKKIVFGTDMPWYSPYYAAGAVLFARITDEERHDILHRNAEKLLSDFM